MRCYSRAAHCRAARHVTLGPKRLLTMVVMEVIVVMVVVVVMVVDPLELLIECAIGGGGD